MCRGNQHRAKTNTKLNTVLATSRLYNKNSTKSCVCKVTFTTQASTRKLTDICFPFIKKSLHHFYRTFILKVDLTLKKKADYFSKFQMGNMITTSPSASLHFPLPQEHAEKHTDTRDELMNQRFSRIKRDGEWMIIWSYLTPFSSLTGNLSECGACQKTSQTQENQLHKEHDELRQARADGARDTQEN